MTRSRRLTATRRAPPGAGRIASAVVDSDEGGANAGARIRRRDRRGRGLRGRLVPPTVPMYRTRAEQFDDIVLDAVARLEPRWESELSSVEFAVQEVPEAEELADDAGEIPLARVIPGTPDSGDPNRPATPVRIVIYRRPLLARAENDDELSDLVFEVVVEELARALGIDPDSIDPEE